MPGLAQAAHLAGEELTQPAKRAADWYSSRQLIGPASNISCHT
jgi:hypothetical protein